VFDRHPLAEDFRATILTCLTQQPKAVPAKCLYDKRGAELFDQITQQPEYYPTRTELKILAEHGQEIAAHLADGVLVEYGSGSSQKVRLLLDAVALAQRPLPVYVGLDISQQHLIESCEALAQQYVGLETVAICADYNQPLSLPAIAPLQGKTKTAFFPGSTLGNLQPNEALAFLGNVAQLVGSGGGLLIGVDLKKDRAMLEAAYDDAAGVSAEFALNLLQRINRELGGDFDLTKFRYCAPYNESAGRIEMYIESCLAQTVTVAGQPIAFGAGERLLTEHSYKYSPESLGSLAAQAGFEMVSRWVDDQGLFLVAYLVVKPGPLELEKSN
jgi:dimethylhistidine N-methyltransferase